MNRIWHYHFGEGIVASPSDFGAMGQRPTHPELLDWLAAEFVSSGWDIKHMHKLIVMSNTYQQSSAHNEVCRQSGLPQPPAVEVPARAPGRRSDPRFRACPSPACSIRKSAAPASIPNCPPEQERRAAAGRQHGSRRAQTAAASTSSSAATHAIPMMEVFDMPDTHECCGRRNHTITAPQALTMLNDKVSFEWSQAFAGRVLKAAGIDDKAQIEQAYRLAYGRTPDGWEKDTVLTFFDQHGKIARTSAKARNEELALPADVPTAWTGPRRGAGRLLPHAAQLERIRLPELEVKSAWHTNASLDSRRDFLANAGCGLGALALGSMLAENGLAGGNGRRRSARAQAAAFQADRQVGDLALHGRRPEPHRPVRSQAELEQARRASRCRRRSAGRSRPWAPANNTLMPSKRQVEAVRAERHLGVGLVSRNREARRRHDACSASCWADGLNHVGSVCQMNTGSILAGRPRSAPG